MCDVSSLVRKGSRVAGALLNGVGGSGELDVEDFGVEDIVLKARALDFPFGGMMRSGCMLLEFLEA